LYFDESRGGFHGLGFERAAIQVLTTTQRLWKRLGVTGPTVLGLVLSGVKGWKMVAGPFGSWDPRETIDADVTIIPEIVVQDENTPAAQALRPVFDLAWNAGGWPRSPFYDPATGERKEPR
jgi:hypothetical protein